MDYGIGTNKITDKEIKKAVETLQTYKQGKAFLENRLIQDEQWYKLRHWETIGRDREDDFTQPKATSAWLLNIIMSKHADAMDNFPVPAVLPREKSDEETANILTEVLPVIMENNNFDDTYSLCWWDKLKHGTGVYSVVWNPEKDNGLGDIDIKQIDLLNLFWEPGITNIQDSKNLFITKLWDKDVLESKYPDVGEINGNAIDVSHYIYDDTVDTTDKVVVVDWYYKKGNILHFCKFVNDKVLEATENDPELSQTGLYDHGMYPVVFDVLYPEKGTPVGFGFVTINKNPQLYVDSIESNLLESSMMGSKKRFVVSGETHINEDEFMDWTKPVIHAEGSIDDLHFKEFTLTPVSPIYSEIVTQKIQEMKETSGNRDMNTGGSYSGITAASAIAALQEAGNKTSRDMISTSYRVYNDITAMIVELIRQHYDEERTFRITGEDNSYTYATLSNADMQFQTEGYDEFGNELVRKPIFDYKMKALKQNPFSRMEENERAKELYSLGFFNPERAQEALIALDMMDFEGIDKIKEKVGQGQTLLNQLQQAMSQIQEMAAELMGAGLPLPPSVIEMAGPAPSAPPEPSGVSSGNHKTMTDQVMASRVPRKPYTQGLVERSKMELR